MKLQCWIQSIVNAGTKHKRESLSLSCPLVVTLKLEYSIVLYSSSSCVTHSVGASLVAYTALQTHTVGTTDHQDAAAVHHPHHHHHHRRYQRLLRRVHRRLPEPVPWRVGGGLCRGLQDYFH